METESHENATPGCRLQSSSCGQQHRRRQRLRVGSDRYTTLNRADAPGGSASGCRKRTPSRTADRPCTESGRCRDSTWQEAYTSSRARSSSFPVPAPATMTSNGSCNKRTTGQSADCVCVCMCLNVCARVREMTVAPNVRRSVQSASSQSAPSVECPRLRRLHPVSSTGRCRGERPQ